MFAYCINCPTRYSDDGGSRPVVGDNPNTESQEEREASIVAVYGIRVDITEMLTLYMEYNAEQLKKYLREHGYYMTVVYFCSLVKDGGDLDIKRRPEWQFEPGKRYYFNKTLLRYDDPGNICFGYVGAVLFDVNTLCFGAGVNQISKFGFRFGNLTTYYDDPRDNAMIKRGYSLYTTGSW